jgi:hypothetical protein
MIDQKFAVALTEARAIADAERPDSIAIFETWADLYYRRYGRLVPGKSEPLETGRDSSDEENYIQHEAWHASRLSILDAIRRIIELEKERRESHE